jgi:hypothetical protein
MTDGCLRSRYEAAVVALCAQVAAMRGDGASPETIAREVHAERRRLTALNGFGTRRPGAVLASMYRHLAHWPTYLSFAWLLLAPLDGDDGWQPRSNRRNVRHR